MPLLNSKMLDCSLDKWSLDFIAKNRSLLEKHLDLTTIISSMNLKNQQMEEINELVSITQNREGQNQIFLKFIEKSNQSIFKKFLKVLSKQQKVLYNILQSNKPKEEIGNVEDISNYCLSGYQIKNIINNYLKSKDKKFSNIDLMNEVNNSSEHQSNFEPLKSFSTSKLKKRTNSSEMFELNIDVVFRLFNKPLSTTNCQNTYIFCCDFDTFSKVKDKQLKQCKKLKKGSKQRGISKRSHRRYLAVRRHSTKPPPLPPKPRSFSNNEVKQQYKGNIPFEFRHNEVFLKKYVLNNDSKKTDNTCFKKEEKNNKMISVLNKEPNKTNIITNHFNSHVHSLKQHNSNTSTQHENTSVKHNFIQTTKSTLNANNSYIESIHHKKNKKLDSKQQVITKKCSPNDNINTPISIHYTSTPPSPHNNTPSQKISPASSQNTNIDSPHNIKSETTSPQKNNSTPFQPTNSLSNHSKPTEKKNFDSLDVNVGFDYNLPGDESNDEDNEKNDNCNDNNNNDYDAEIDVEIGFDDDDDVVGNYYHVQKSHADAGESGYDDVVVQENDTTTASTSNNNTTTTISNNDTLQNIDDDRVNSKEKVNNVQLNNSNKNTQNINNVDNDTQDNRGISYNTNTSDNSSNTNASNIMNIINDNMRGDVDDNDYQCYNEDIKLPVKTYNRDDDDYDDGWDDDYDENLFKEDQFVVFDEPLYEHIENLDDYDCGAGGFGDTSTTGIKRYRKGSHHNRDATKYDDVKVLKKGELLILMQEVVEIGYDDDDDDDKSYKNNDDVVHNDDGGDNGAKSHELDKNQSVEKMNPEKMGVTQNLIDITLANHEAEKDSAKVCDEETKKEMEDETVRKSEVVVEEVHGNQSNQKKYSVKNNIEKFNSLCGQKKELNSNDAKQEDNLRNIDSLFLTEHQLEEHNETVHDNGNEVNRRNDEIEIPRKSSKTFSTYSEMSDKRGDTYLVPQSVFNRVFKEQHNHTNQPWFHPVPLRPLHASLFLKREAINGAFVVYKPAWGSDDDGLKATMYILSVYFQRQHCTMHYNIKQLSTEELVVEGSDQRFDHLTELVEYYRYDRGGLALRLRVPLKYSNLPISQGIHYNADLLLRDVEVVGMIDDGDDGIVGYKGRYGSGNVNMLAVYKSEEDVETQVRLLDMAHLMRQLKHESVLKLVGIVDEVDVLMLVTEQLCDKTLQHLFDNRSQSFGTQFCFDICLQVVNVMEYLEVQKVILRDLSSSSFHLCVKQFGTFSLKLTGLKQARKLLRDVYRGEDEEIVEMKRASVEVLENLKYSVKSDVWAFGLLAWESFSLFKAFQNFSSFEAAMFVLDGGRLDRPEDCPIDFYWLLLNCWKENPVDRPSFKNLKKKLISQSETILSSNVSHWSMDSLASAKKIHSLVSLPTNQAPPLVPRRLSDKDTSQQDVLMTSSFHDNNSLLRREKKINSNAINIDKRKSNTTVQVKQLLPFHLSKQSKEGSQSPKIDSPIKLDTSKQLQRYSSRVVEQVSRQEQLNKHLSCQYNKASLMELTIHEDLQACHSDKCVADKKHGKLGGVVDNKQNAIDSSSNEGFDNSKSWRRSLQKKFSKNNKYKITN